MKESGRDALRQGQMWSGVSLARPAVVRGPSGTTVSGREALWKGRKW